MFFVAEIRQNYETVGTSTTKHIYANGTLVSTIEGVGSTSASVFHNHQDHLGSTAAVTSDIGYLTRLYNYYPYGTLRLDEGSTTTSFTQSNQFIGQNRDVEADLSYLNARYYSSNNGQFTSQDPVFWEVGQSRDGNAVMYNPQAQNSYSYAQNNPIVLKDPDGQIAFAFLPVLGAVVSAYSTANIGVDLYNLYNTYRYSDGYSQTEKDDARNKVLKDVTSFGVGKLGNAAFRVGLDTVDAVLDGSKYSANQTVKFAASVRDAQAQNNGKIYQSTPSRSNNSSKSKEVKQTRQTTISAPDYGSASKNLEKANQALKAGNYTDAIKYANRANQSIKKPK